VTNFHLIETQARAHTAELTRQAHDAQKLHGLRPGLRRHLAALAHTLADRLDSPVTAHPDAATA
jgi:hypothetical protein